MADTAKSAERSVHERETLGVGGHGWPAGRRSTVGTPAAHSNREQGPTRLPRLAHPPVPRRLHKVVDLQQQEAQPLDGVQAQQRVEPHDVQHRQQRGGHEGGHGGGGVGQGRVGQHDAHHHRDVAEDVQPRLALLLQHGWGGKQCERGGRVMEGGCGGGRVHVYASATKFEYSHRAAHGVVMERAGLGGEGKGMPTARHRTAPAAAAPGGPSCGSGASSTPGRPG